MKIGHLWTLCLLAFMAACSKPDSRSASDPETTPDETPPSEPTADAETEGEKTEPAEPLFPADQEVPLPSEDMAADAIGVAVDTNLLSVNLPADALDPGAPEDVNPSDARRTDNWESPPLDLSSGFNLAAAPLWDGAFEGKGSPAAYPTPHHLWWGNPHDDDLDAYPLVRGMCRYRFDWDDKVRAPGFMTVDRNTGPAPAQLATWNGTTALSFPNCAFSTGDGGGGLNFTGNISRRDEALSDAAGATIEFRVKIPDRHWQVQHDAFTVSYTHDKGSASVYLSPNCVKLGQLRRPSGPQVHQCASAPGYVAKVFDATGFHTYRLTKDPATNGVKLYIDGATTPALALNVSGSPTIDLSQPFVRKYPPGTKQATGDTGYELPTLLLGDNTTNPMTDADVDRVSATYVLDYVRYRRGAVAPGQSVALAPRSAPALPPRDPAPTTFDKTLEFDTLPAAVATPLRTLSGSGKTSIVDIGSGKKALKVTAASNFAYIYTSLDKASGIIPGEGAITIELRAKLDAGSADRAFSMNLFDHLGSVSLVLSPGKVELALGLKYLGFSVPVAMNTTDQFHKYRLVRPENSPFVFLYVDDQVRPVIADFPLSQVQMNPGYAGYAEENRLRLGWNKTILPTKWVETAVKKPVKPNGVEFYPQVTTEFGIEIDSLQWKAGAFGP